MRKLRTNLPRSARESALTEVREDVTLARCRVVNHIDVCGGRLVVHAPACVKRVRVKLKFVAASHKYTLAAPHKLTDNTSIPIFPDPQSSCDRKKRCVS